MTHLDKLRERMCKELDDIAAKDTFGVRDLELSHMLIADLNGLKELCPAAYTADTGTEDVPSHGHANHLTMDQAKRWVSTMANADGTAGAHWPPEQTNAVMAQRGITCDKADFFAAMNMLYSDYCMVAKAYSADNPNFYADLAAAFLHDKDAAPGKMVTYWESIPAGR